MKHLQIIKVYLVVGLGVKFVLLFKKLGPFKTRIKVKHLTLEKGFWTVAPIWLFTWLSVNHDLSSMWVVLLHRSVAVLIIIKVGLEKSQKFIPRNLMPVKNNFTVTLTLRDTMGWRNIIDRAENVLELRRRESYWQHRLHKFIPNGLNEHFVVTPML